MSTKQEWVSSPDMVLAWIMTQHNLLAFTSRVEVPQHFGATPILPSHRDATVLRDGAMSYAEQLSPSQVPLCNLPPKSSTPTLGPSLYPEKQEEVKKGMRLKLSSL